MAKYGGCLTPFVRQMPNPEPAALNIVALVVVASFYEEGMLGMGRGPPRYRPTLTGML